MKIRNFLRMGGVGTTAELWIIISTISSNSFFINSFTVAIFFTWSLSLSEVDDDELEGRGCEKM